MGNDFNDVLSLRLIKNDYDDLINLVRFTSKEEYASIFFMGLSPYISLCLFEGIEFSEKHDAVFKNHIENYEVIKKTRLNIKIFDNSFNKNITVIERIDYLNDLHFSSLKSKIEAKLNCYYNLGIYFNKDGEILFNSQLSNYFFSPLIFENRTEQEIENIYLDHRINESLEEKNPIINNATLMGSYLASISEGVGAASPIFKEKYCEFMHIKDKIEHKDYNTNSCFDMNYYYGLKKEIILLLLHLLSVINNIRYLYNEVVLKDNGLRVRIGYIAYDYTIKNLKQLSRHLYSTGNVNNEIYNQIKYISENCSKLHNKSFGNHMRHYGINVKDYVLSEKSFIDKLDLPLVGLVESHYDGMSFFEFENNLNTQINFISDLLDSCFNINRKNRSI